MRLMAAERAQMKNTLSRIIVTAALLLGPGSAYAQLEFPSPSPKARIEQKVGLGTVTIDYSRPGLKDREMLGQQVPYGQLWRTGANASTKLTFSEAVTLEGQAVPAGTYSVVTIPGESTWKVMLNKELDLGNVSKYDKANDVASFEVKPRKLSTPVETLTFDVADIRDDSAHIVLSWGKVAVPMKLTLNTTAKVMANIKTEMAKPDERKAGEYANAAGFYYEHGGDLNDALKWIDKALVMQPEAFYWIHRKALILAKLGRKDEARAEATRSMKMAESNPAFREEYTWKNKQLIESL
jgi:tetratricopeptide (TPR) repeat protein